MTTTKARQSRNEQDADAKISNLVDALNSTQKSSKKVSDFKRLSSSLRRAK